MHRAPGAASTAARGRVAVAMSGGVDSSVAAALLVEQGWEVVGVHMKLHEVPDSEKRAKSCCSIDDALDARQVCARLGIPFYVIDFVEEFHARVISYFVEGYRAGRTPNPCVMCNQTVKNALLLERVREYGCEYLATGHYAALRRNPATGAHEIVRPRDRRKDQTYFLWGTPRHELPHLLFPLADYEKPRAREVAAQYDFVTWDKPDSQEVCFVPKDYRDFLKPRLTDAPPPPGDFVDAGGRVLGRHRGLPYYTVGQRRGIGIAAEQPLYVVELRPGRNEVLLGAQGDLYTSTLRVSGVNWVSRPPAQAPLETVVKIRYAHEGTPARIAPLGSGGARIDFKTPVRAAAPGQAAVFYQGDVLLGGGWIEP
jgi:tRNA-specific 2-thiouridylase